MTTTYLTTKTDLLDRLKELWGADDYLIQRESCRGAYRGTYDYSIVFIKNGMRDIYYVSNGKKYFNDKIKDLIKFTESFYRYKQDLINFIRTYENIDNLYAQRLNLQPYTILDIEIVKHGNYIGWLCIKLQVGDTVIKHLETNTECIMKMFLRGDVEQAQTIINNHYKRGYYVAGGTRDKNVDYIFHNVGFSTKDDLYKVDMQRTCKAV